MSTILIDEEDIGAITAKLAEIAKKEDQSFGEYRFVDTFSSKEEAVEPREGIGFSFFDVYFDLIAENRVQNIPQELQQYADNSYKLKFLFERVSQDKLKREKYSRKYDGFTKQVLTNVGSPTHLGINIVLIGKQPYHEFFREDLGDNFQVSEGKNGRRQTWICDDENRARIYRNFAQKKFHHEAISISEYEQSKDGVFTIKQHLFSLPRYNP